MRLRLIQFATKLCSKFFNRASNQTKQVKEPYQAKLKNNLLDQIQTKQKDDVQFGLGSVFSQLLLK